MRLILSHLLQRFDFSLAAPYDRLRDVELKVDELDRKSFRGVNRGGTMGPMDLERGGAWPFKERFCAAGEVRCRPVSAS